jgi:hypothetical protein
MFARFTRLAMLARLSVFTRFAMLARLLLVALIGLAVAIALMLALAIVTVAAIAITAVTVTEIRLGLHRHEARLLAEIRKALAVIIELIRRGDVVDVARLRLVLAELLLRGGDQAEIVFGVLIVILRSNRIAGGAGIARELDVFLGDMGGSAADLDVRPIRLEHPGQRVLAAPVIITVIPVAHPLVVLTVSHVLPLFQPYVRNSD